MVTSGLKWQPIKASFPLKGGGSFEGPIGAAAAVATLRDVVFPQGMVDGAAQLAQDMEVFARANASWQDRTGDARRGLAGVPFADAGQVGASIVHTVPYGIFLENKHNGAYAIITRTQETFAPLAARILGGSVRAAIEGRGSRVRDVKTGRFA